MRLQRGTGGAFLFLALFVTAASATAPVESDEVEANKRRLTRQYSTLPYPARSSNDGIYGINSVDLPTVSYTCFGGRYGSIWHRPDLRILDAGGGTGDSTLTLAKQLHTIGNHDARIVHLDLSPTSQAIARDRAHLAGIDALIEFRVGSLLDEALMKSLGKFDFIVCHGVLHHLPSPVDGLLSLKRALKPGGAMSVMAYGQLGRTGIYDVQQMMRLMKATASEDEHEEVTSLRSLLSALPGTSRVKRSPAFWAAVQSEVSTGAGAFDLFLHSQDRAYNVDELFEWVEDQCGLRIVAFNERGLYDPMLWLAGATEDLARRVHDVEARREKMRLAELLHGAIQRHSFYVLEPAATTTQPPVAANTIPCAPRNGQLDMSAFQILGEGSNFTVSVARDVSYASSVFTPGTQVRYDSVNLLLQFPWIYGDCQRTFEDIWREYATPLKPDLPLGVYLQAMEGIVKMLGDWGDLAILTEPGQRLPMRDPAGPTVAATNEREL